MNDNKAKLFVYCAISFWVGAAVILGLLAGINAHGRSSCSRWTLDDYLTNTWTCGEATRRGQE